MLQNRVADQHLWFLLNRPVLQSLYFPNLKFQAAIHLYTCTARFVSDLVGNPEDRRSQDMAFNYYFSYTRKLLT